MSKTRVPPGKPQRHEVADEDRAGLVHDVRAAISALPAYFRTTTRIEGYVPFIEQARYVAEYRNWWWSSERKTSDAPEQREIRRPTDGVGPYPEPKTRIADRAVKDGGGNFGRIARVEGLMDDWTATMRKQPIGGIPAEHWISFFRLHAEAKDPAEILQHLTKELVERGLERDAADDVTESISRIVGHLR